MNSHDTASVLRHHRGRERCAGDIDVACAMPTYYCHIWLSRECRDMHPVSVLVSTLKQQSSSSLSSMSAGTPTSITFVDYHQAHEISPRPPRSREAPPRRARRHMGIGAIDHQDMARHRFELWCSSASLNVNRSGILKVISHIHRSVKALPHKSRYVSTRCDGIYFSAGNVNEAISLHARKWQAYATASLMKSTAVVISAEIAMTNGEAARQRQSIPGHYFYLASSVYEMAAFWYDAKRSNRPASSHDGNARLVDRQVWSRMIYILADTPCEEIRVVGISKRLIRFTDVIASALLLSSSEKCHFRLSIWFIFMGFTTTTVLRRDDKLHSGRFFPAMREIEGIVISASSISILFRGQPAISRHRLVAYTVYYFSSWLHFPLKARRRWPPAISRRGSLSPARNHAMSRLRPRFALQRLVSVPVWH